VNQSTCQSDYFRAKCVNDDVIMITSAHYGRMEISKCVKESFGFLGCNNDVLQIMDSYCSGRRECSVRILDENFMNIKPCHDDLKSYLEVKYTCVKGTSLIGQANYTSLIIVSLIFSLILIKSTNRSVIST